MLRKKTIHGADALFRLALHEKKLTFSTSQKLLLAIEFIEVLALLCPFTQKFAKRDQASVHFPCQG